MNIGRRNGGKIMEPLPWDFWLAIAVVFVVLAAAQR